MTGSETCDDGNLVPLDGCSGTCQVEVGWNCIGTSPTHCNICPNSIVESPTESCDDGNSVSGDGCSDLCQIE